MLFLGLAGQSARLGFFPESFLIVGKTGTLPEFFNPYPGNSASIFTTSGVTE
jgi:hypothetical protein